MSVCVYYRYSLFWCTFIIPLRREVSLLGFYDTGIAKPQRVEPGRIKIPRLFCFRSEMESYQTIIFFGQ